MKFFLKHFLRIHVFIYRLTGGRLGSEMRGFTVLLLNSVGRKTGNVHTNPLGYFMDGGNYIITASYVAFGAYPAWYHNLKAKPDTTIQVKNRVIKVEAEIADPVERQRLWTKLMEVAPGYADYQKRTEREIPFAFGSCVAIQPDVDDKPGRCLLAS